MNDISTPAAISARTRRETRKAMGLCRDCGMRPIAHVSRCERCALRNRRRNRIGDAVRPRFDTYKVGDVASNLEIRRDDDMRSDNTDAWNQRCEPLVAFLSEPRTLDEVRNWGRYHWEKRRQTKFGANLAEECLYWLESRGRVYRGADRKWRVINGR